MFNCLPEEGWLRLLPYERSAQNPRHLTDVPILHIQSVQSYFVSLLSVTGAVVSASFLERMSTSLLHLMHLTGNLNHVTTSKAPTY